MKILKWLSIYTVVFTILFGINAYAVDTGQAVVDLFSAIKVGTLSAILLAVGQLLKSDLISSIIGAKVNTKFLPWITIAIGALISVGHGLAEGKIWYMSLAEGLIAGLLSNGIFDQTKPLQSS